ncbi:hypothetical protein [Sinorhizobium medicae]|uniref:hypothetical protein n=1 Tax=Sinorhizobium medicae TaxID=110321 RepID=UPI001F1C229C|nr:hypothetical protein [Sinorhizobium medicae]
MPDPLYAVHLTSGIAHTGADRDTAALIAVDDPVQLNRYGDIVVEFGKGMD